MIIITNKLIPFGSYDSINLFGIVFTKGAISETDKNHEAIHSEQMIELAMVTLVILSLLVFTINISWLWLLLSPCTFYVLYGLEYVCIRLFHKKQNDAYHDVSFEEEAYNNDDNLDYINNRSYFAWFKYLKLKSYGKY